MASKVSSPLAEAVSRFGAALKPKFSGKGAVGAPEDQLRAPLESLFGDVAAINFFREGDVVPVGESTLSDLKTRPDYAVKVRNALVGFIEVKATDKGADPRRFKDEHDKAQWKSLNRCPTLSTPAATPSPRVCDGPTIPAEDVRASPATTAPQAPGPKRARRRVAKQMEMPT